MTEPIQTERVAPGVLRLPLPSRTLPPFDHTNSYVVSDGGVGVLVDAGSDTLEAVEVVKRALEETGVTFLKAILLTHTHSDHLEGVARVQAHFGDPPVYVHPLELPRLTESGAKNARALPGDRTLTVGDKTVRALHTPGHSPGHLSFYLPDPQTLLAGDVVAGEGSTWVGLPEGDVAAFLKTVEGLLELPLTTIGPGHGPLVTNPKEKLEEIKAHRLAREGQVLAALEGSPLTLAELRRAVYPELHPELEGMAERSLLAGLKKLMNEMRVLHVGADEAGPYALRR